MRASGRTLAPGIGLLLAVSGAAALAHQAVWFRVLLPALGAGARTAGVVSAGALLGLALGAALGGRVAPRLKRPLLLVAVAEALGGVLGLAVPAAAAFLTRAITAGTSAGGLGETPAILLATGLCALAAFPLGVTVPAALAALRAGGPGGAATLRWTYAMNTFGAVLGALAAAGWLLEDLGNRGTAFHAAAGQGLAALLALLLARPVEPSPQPPALPPPGPLARVRPAPDVAPTRAPLRGVWAAAFLAGAAGLAVQIAWVRRLTPAVGTTTQSFATVLAAHLLAIALGSLLLGPRRTSADRAWLVLLLSAVPAALLPPAILPVARWTSEQALASDGGAFALLGARASAAGLLLVPSTLLASAALPWLLLRARPGPGAAAAAAGPVLGWNCAGSALGALLTGWAWVPAVGTAAVLRGAGGLLLAAAACVAPRRGIAVGLGVLGLALVVLPLAGRLPDDAGRDAVGASFLPAQFAIADAPALAWAEGSATTVVVREREGHRELWVEGKIEASTQPTDRLHLTLLGALPMALHPRPGSVAIVGLGTGRTAQAVAAFGPQRLLVLEIEAEVVRHVGAFAGDGGGLPAEAEVRLGDARHALARSAERFDVITSDPVHPGVAGSAALYASEMYALVRERLAPGGVFCQWLPLYQHTLADVRLAVRTFTVAFPEAWAFLAGEDLILVGATEPVRVDEARLRERLAAPGPRGVLAPLGLASPGRLLGLVLRGPAALARTGGSGPLNTDDRLLLEFQAGRSWFVQEPFENLRHLALGRARAHELLAAPPEAAFRAEAEDAERLFEAVRTWLGGQTERAAQAFEALAAADPEDVFSREMAAMLWIRAAGERADAGDHEGALASSRTLAARGDLTASQRLDAAGLLRDLGALEEGRRLAAKVAAALPDSPRARRLAGP